MEEEIKKLLQQIDRLKRENKELRNTIKLLTSELHNVKLENHVFKEFLGGE